MEDNLAHSDYNKGSYTWIITASIVLVLVLTLAWYTLEKIEGRIKADTKALLISTLDTTQESINMWFNERAREVEYTANQPLFKKLAHSLLRDSGSAEVNAQSPVLKKLREYLVFSTHAHRDQGFFLLSPDFTNIASSRDSNMGERNILADHGDYLERIFAGETVLALPVKAKVLLPGPDGKLTKGQPTMFIGVPVKESGKVVAAFLVRLDPSHRFNYIIQMSRFGGSGDIYAFDTLGRFISEPKFEDELREAGLIDPTQSSILLLSVRDPGGNIMKGFKPSGRPDERPLTLMAASAVKKMGGIDLEGYRDYRGIEVVGAWLWNDELGFALTTEIDASEAYASLNIIRRTVGLVIGFTMLLFSGLVLLVIIRNRRLDQEIDERRRAEGELYLFRALMDKSADALYIIEPETARFLDVNSAACTELGYSRVELLNLSVLDISEDADRAFWKGHVEELKQLRVITLEVRHIRKDKTKFPVEVKVSYVEHAGKSYVVANARDITERIQANADINKLTIAVDQSPSAVIITDMTGTIEYANKKFCDITGYSRDEVIGKNPRMLKSGFQPPEFYDELWKTITSGKEWRGEFHNKKKDGETFWESAIIAPIKDGEGNITHYIALKEDITERKRVEDRLRTLSLVLDQSPASTIILNTDLHINYVNPACLEATGYTTDELLGKKIEVLRSDEHTDGFFDAIWAKAREGKTWRGDICSRCKDGSKKWELINVSPVLNSRGEVKHFVFVTVDDTERKRAEEALRSSEAHQRLIFDSTVEAIYGVDSKGECTFANKACVKILGYDSVDELLGRNMHSLIHHTRKDGSNYPVNECRIYEAFQKDRGTHADDELLWKKDKTSFEAEYWSHPIRKDDEVVGSVVTFLDITDQKMLEAEVIKAQKLESIGLLAGGIAHDFNNLLTSIVGNTDFAKLLCEPGEKIYERLEKVEKASAQATALTQQLLSFSKGGERIMRVLSVIDVVKESLEISLRGSNVSSDLSAPDDLSLVNADSGQLSQVFNNLIINAAQSMPDGGNITIKCKNLQIKSSSETILKQGNYVRISVEDTGCGINEEDLNRIFDPYFTTKDTGTGLGLATAYSIIHNHGGVINVKSIVGKGTVINLYLPAIDTQGEKKGRDSAELFKGAGRILIMDDDHEIGDYISLALDSCGYRSRLVFTGEEAVDEYRAALETKEPYDAVIMDLVIKGGMGGKETIDKLKEIDPDVVGIVSSGYSNDPVMVSFEDFGFKSAIAKPYKVAELSKVLSEVLKKG